jgi:hypothetical protein
MLKMSSANLEHAAIAKAMGHYVEMVKQPGSRRVVFYFDQDIEVSNNLDRYEQRLCIDVPAKSIADSRNTLYHASRAVREGL